MQDHTLPLKRLINFERIGPVPAGDSATVGFVVSPMAHLQFATAAVRIDRAFSKPGSSSFDRFDRYPRLGAVDLNGRVVKVTPCLCLVVEQGGMALYEGTHEIVFWRGSGAEVTFPIEVQEAGDLVR